MSRPQENSVFSSEVEHGKSICILGAGVTGSNPVIRNVSTVETSEYRIVIIIGDFQSSDESLILSTRSKSDVY